MIKVINVQSHFDISKEEKVNLKLMSNFKKVDELEDGAMLEIFNTAEITCLMKGDPDHKDEDRRVDKEYPVYVYITQDDMYSTSSQSLNEDIEDMMSEVEQGQGVKIILRKIPSKNNKGCFFRAALVEFIE